MMNGKNVLALACAAAASMLHPAAEAASERDGLEACVSALTKEISDTHGAGVEARISEDSLAGRGRLGARSKFYLDARDSRNEEIVLKADCVVNSRGQVRSLITLPDDAPAAEERSL
jgi:cation transport ATPase